MLAEPTTDAPRALPSGLPPTQGTGQLIVYSILTLGIYTVYRFCVIVWAYQRMSGRRTAFVPLAGGYFVLSLASFFVELGMLDLVVRLPLGIALLVSALRSRDAAAAPYPEVRSLLKPQRVHISLWAIGNAIGYVSFGTVLLITQAIYFFSEYNEIIHAARMRQLPIY